MSSVCTEFRIGPGSGQGIMTVMCSGKHAVVDGLGAVCILKLILLPQEGLPRISRESHTQVTSCEPSPNE